MFVKDPFDLFVRHEIREAVGTQKQLIAFAELRPREIDLDLLRDAEGAGDVILFRVVLRE